MGNTNPTPFTGKDGNQYVAVLAGVDGSGNADALKTNGSGVLLTSVSGAGSGGTSATDDAAFTAATDAGTPMMGFASADTVNSGDVGVVGMTTDRHLKINIASSDVAIGGGTEYTEGDTDASITGGAILWEDTSDTLRAVSAAKPLPIDVKNASVAVTAASLPLPTGAATSANQTTANGLLTTIAGAVAGTEVQVDVLTMPTTTVQATNLDIRDLSSASDTVTVHGDVGVLDQFDLTSSNPAAVAIVDGNGDQITSFGGGTQYTEGDTDASITGTAMLMEGAANALVPAQGTVADGLLVNLGANNDVTVAGVSTAANQTTIIGHVDGIETLLGTIDTDTGNIASSVSSIDSKTPALGQALAAASVPVVLTAAQLTTLTPPAAITGFGTAANQTTIIGHLDGVEGLLTTIDADTGEISAHIGTLSDAAATAGGTGSVSAKLRLATSQLDSIKTAVETLDNAISGSEMQVDVVAALPAGTNNIGDVDVLTLPGTGIEDAAETAGGTLLMAGSVRRDTAASSAGTTGDNATINTDATGRLWTTGTVLEDVAHAAGESMMANAVRRIDTAATSAGTSGDWATMDASAEGALWVTTTPTTTSGCLTFRSIDLDETEEEVKATAGNIYGYYFYNAAASIRYLKFYNATAASTTVGTTTPMRTYPIPAGAAGHVSLAYPIAFSTALSVAVTTGLADNDTGAPGANDFVLNLDYK